MTNSDRKSIRSYTQDDVQQILHLAIARQADDQNKEFSYAQILEIADDLQISPELLKLAEGDWLVQQGEMQRRLSFDIYRQKRFQKRLGNYAMVSGFLVLIDFIGGWSISWSLYPLCIFILLSGLEGWNTFNKGEEYEIAFQNWSRRHQLKKSFGNLINRFLKAAS